MQCNDASRDGSALTEGLGPPAQPLRYYCNKCGHMGAQGPEHDVFAGYPQQRCHYSAVAWGPFWSTDQLSAAVAAERERCAKLCEEVARKHRAANYGDFPGPGLTTTGESGAEDCAAAIRGA